MSFRNGFYAGALLSALAALWLAQLWDGEKQVRLHSEHFLQQIEQRHWSKLGDFIATDYHDDWGHDQAEVLSRLRFVLRCFSSLTITPSRLQVSVVPPAGWWSAKVQLAGEGCEDAPQVTQRVNRLSEPFVLHWRRQSWRPWDWKLVRVSNPALDLSGRCF
ncbi:MAG: hypothetical protein ACR2G0_05455 [Chthoniobacterales bacterium]